MSFFRALYTGQLCPAEEIPDTDEFRTAQKALSKASQKLHDSLTAEQRELLENYQSAFADCTELIYAEAFRQGFLHGAEFIKEIPHTDRLPKTE